jgi:putative copper export protein
VELLFNVLHVLAAAVWVGGTVVLVFVSVPVIRRLEGAERATALRELGRRWRPIGYGALGLLGLSGLALAGKEHVFSQGGSAAWLLGTKIVLSVVLVIVAVWHDYVLGPRLAREIREGQPQRSRPLLVRVGWTSFALTIVLPILGVVLAAKLD